MKPALVGALTALMGALTWCSDRPPQKFMSLEYEPSSDGGRLPGVVNVILGAHDTVNFIICARVITCSYSPPSYTAVSSDAGPDGCRLRVVHLLRSTCHAISGCCPLSLSHRNAQRFQGGLVFKAHRLGVLPNSRRASNNADKVDGVVRPVDHVHHPGRPVRGQQPLMT